MSSWHYAFLFPGSDQELAPANAIHAFVDDGLEFEKRIRLAVIIDEVGHLDYGQKVELGEDNIHEIQRRLSEGDQFLIECRNRELFFSCVFATHYANPFIAFGWSSRLFVDLSISRKEKYFKLLRRFAKLSNAGYVLLVNDPPDFFEDRFIDIDGQRYLEVETPSGNRYDIYCLWVDEKMTRIPEGVNEILFRRVVDGFLEYSM